MLKHSLWQYRNVCGVPSGVQAHVLVYRNIHKAILLTTVSVIHIAMPPSQDQAGSEEGVGASEAASGKAAPYNLQPDMSSLGFEQRILKALLQPSEDLGVFRERSHEEDSVWR